MWSSWKTRYDVRLECHVRPGDPLINRAYREFRKFQMSVHDVRKWKSVLLEKTPDYVQETRVSSRAKLVEGVTTEFRYRTIMEYYLGLRTLVNAWAIAGNYDVDSMDKEGKKVTMMPADQALDYADRGLRLASKADGSEAERLDWWARKCYMTRTLMANYVRDKYPAGEALTLNR